MKSMLAIAASACLLAPAAGPQAQAFPSQGPVSAQGHRTRVRPSLQKQINRAIDRGLEKIIEGRLGGGRKRGRKVTDQPGAGLVLYAAMHAGIDRSSDAFQAALRDVAKEVPSGTYERACSILALTKADSGAYRSDVDRLVNRLVASQEREGGWGYPGNEDLSNTQYAALGLWTAARHGSTVPVKVWVELADALPSYTGPYGGFSYRRSGGAPTLSMTAAGVACASICLDRLGADDRGRRELTPERARSLRLMEARGMEWMADQYGPGQPFGPGIQGWSMYAIYGVERAAALTGTTHLGSRDWYADGALYLVGTQREDGTWNGSGGGDVPTAFGILFLVRATSRSIGPAISGPRSVATAEALGAVRRRDLGRNRMAASEPVFDSSGAERRHDESLVADDREDTWWQCAKGDAQPHLRLTFQKPHEIESLAFVHPEGDLAAGLALAFELNVRINGGPIHRVEMPADRARHGRLTLAEPVTLERLEVRVRSRREPLGVAGVAAKEAATGDDPSPVGIGEIRLVAARPRLPGIDVPK